MLSWKEERPISILLIYSFHEVKKMDQPMNDICQDQTKLEAAERKLEAAKRELAESKAELAESKANRAAHAFLSDEWKFYNEEVTQCSAMVMSAMAMVMSDKAMILKLTPDPGTYSPPPPHTCITHNPTTLLSTPWLLRLRGRGGIAHACRTRLGCV